MQPDVPLEGGQTTTEQGDDDSEYMDFDDIERILVKHTIRHYADHTNVTLAVTMSVVDGGCILEVMHVATLQCRSTVGDC